MEYSVEKLNRSLANAEAKLRDNPDDSVVKGHVEVLKAELAKLATAPPGESSTFWGDVVGRVGLGQGLSMSGGDEAGAMAERAHALCLARYDARAVGSAFLRLVDEAAA